MPTPVGRCPIPSTGRAGEGLIGVSMPTIVGSTRRLGATVKVGTWAIEIMTSKCVNLISTRRGRVEDVG
jgi:hypothetical protein